MFMPIHQPNATPEHVRVDTVKVRVDTVKANSRSDSLLILMMIHLESDQDRQG